MNEITKFETIKRRLVQEFSYSNISTIILKAIIISFAITIFSLYNAKNQLFYGDFCIRDSFFIATEFFNSYLMNNREFLHGIIIISSFTLDFHLIVTCFQVLAYSKTLRIYFIFLFHYGFRAIIQSIYIMPFPKGFIWEFPGIYSVTVPYHKTADFFYSGHLGCSIICFLELRNNKKKILYFSSLITIFIQFFTLLLTRAHYSIDLFASAVLTLSMYNWITSLYSNRIQNNFEYAKIN